MNVYILVQKKNRPEKFPFTAVSWSLKHFLLRIPLYSGIAWQKKEKPVIPKRFALQANAIKN